MRWHPGGYDVGFNKPPGSTGGPDSSGSHLNEWYNEWTIEKDINLEWLQKPEESRSWTERFGGDNEG